MRLLYVRSKLLLNVHSKRPLNVRKMRLLNVRKLALVVRRFAIQQIGAKHFVKSRILRTFNGRNIDIDPIYV